MPDRRRPGRGVHAAGAGRRAPALCESGGVGEGKAVVWGGGEEGVGAERDESVWEWGGDDEVWGLDS